MITSFINNNIIGSNSSSSNKVLSAILSTTTRRRKETRSVQTVSVAAFTTTATTITTSTTHKRRSHLSGTSCGTSKSIFSTTTTVPTSYCFKTSGTANTRKQQQQSLPRTTSTNFKNINNNYLTSSTSSLFRTTTTTTKRTMMMMMSGSGNNDFDPTMTIQHVNLPQMKELVEEYESKGRDGSGIIIIDVRGYDEINATGKISPNTVTLPLPDIGQKNAFALKEEEFEEEFGFSKPTLDETIVFTCKAGIRSDYAAQIAAMEGPGYTNLINYKGGAMEWFYYSS